VTVETVKKTTVEALRKALSEALRDDDRVVLLGQDIGALGGIFRVTDGLAQQYGPDRVIDTPVSEAGVLGAAIGMAMNGLVPIVEMQFDAFSYPAFEQLVGHLAKTRNRTRGRLGLPVVVRIPVGGGVRAVEHHSDSSESYFAHTAGLRVVTPATPADAYLLLKSAIACPDPVIFLEPKRRYWDRDYLDHVDDGQAMDEAVVRRPGRDVTLIAYGAMVALALDAAEVSRAHGWDVEVIDLRSLAPFDDRTVAGSVRRTGRAVVVHEASQFLGYGAEVVARLTEQCFHHLHAPIMRVTGLDIPYPPPMLEHHHLPSVERILDAIRRLQWDDRDPVTLDV
jgi:2-oxoisovalerate dehydrogenase E1 component beta subunit